METLARAANRGSISTGFNIDNSLKVEAGSGNEALYRDPTSGNRRTFTISFWFKRSQLTGFAADPYFMGQGSNARFHFAGDTIRWMWDGNSTELEASGKLRDPTAWYHIIIAVDTTQSTNTNRVKAYLNGKSYPFNNNDWPSQNSESQWGHDQRQFINVKHANNSTGDTSYDNSGYYSEFCWIDGQQLPATDFGEFDEDSGIWKPIDVSGLTFGSEGYYLKFDDSSNMGKDSSGNSNNFTLVNIDSSNQATDTPTNNFCIMNVAQAKMTGGDSVDITEGGTKLKNQYGTGWRTYHPTMAVRRGKWYFEAKHSGTIDGDAIMIGIIPVHRFGESNRNNFYAGQSSGDGTSFYFDSKRFRYDDGATISPPQNTISSGDIICIALDMDNQYVYGRVNDGSWMNNGTSNGDPTSGSSGTGGFSVADLDTYICITMYHPYKILEVNFGGYASYSISSGQSDGNGYGTFEYSPPSGYYALCTKNLAEYGG